MVHRVPITVRLESFEGPLDLLLYLIQSHELDISKVSIGKVTDQYLAYIRLMQELNFDIASEFLVMASTLLLWKSKALLPQEKSDETAVLEEVGMTQEDLVRQLLEHQRFLAAGQDLAQLPKLGEDVFVRPNVKPPIEKVWKTMDISTITTTYQDILIRANKRVKVLRKETVSLSDKIIEFAGKLQVGVMSKLEALMALDPLFPQLKRPETVVTFLAALELARLKKLRVYQEGTFEPIFVELLENLAQFDVAQAKGFDLPA
jgi:segregation and condensation protein A